MILDMQKNLLNISETKKIAEFHISESAVVFESVLVYLFLWCILIYTFYKGGMTCMAQVLLHVLNLFHGRCSEMGPAPIKLIQCNFCFQHSVICIYVSMYICCFTRLYTPLSSTTTIIVVLYLLMITMYLLWISIWAGNFFKLSGCLLMCKIAQNISAKLSN